MEIKLTENTRLDISYTARPVRLRSWIFHFLNAKLVAPNYDAHRRYFGFRLLGLQIYLVIKRYGYQSQMPTTKM